MLRGDLNVLQRLALLYLMGWEQEQEIERVRQQLKMDMIAAHPEKIKDILEFFDSSEREESTGMTAPQAEYTPEQDDGETSQLVQTLLTQGYAVLEDQS